MKIVLSKIKFEKVNFFDKNINVRNIEFSHFKEIINITSSFLTEAFLKCEKITLLINNEIANEYKNTISVSYFTLQLIYFSKRKLNITKVPTSQKIRSLVRVGLSPNILIQLHEKLKSIGISYLRKPYGKFLFCKKLEILNVLKN